MCVFAWLCIHEGLVLNCCRLCVWVCAACMCAYARTHASVCVCVHKMPALATDVGNSYLGNLFMMSSASWTVRETPSVVNISWNDCTSMNPVRERVHVCVRARPPARVFTCAPSWIEGTLESAPYVHDPLNPQNTHSTHTPTRPVGVHLVHEVPEVVVVAHAGV